MKTQFFEGFILAGGKSSRLGTDKAYLRFQNRTFLERAYDAIAHECEGRVRIVINNEEQLPAVKSVMPEVSCVFDSHKDRGALGGIHAALKNSLCDWTIILACDLPFVTSQTVSNLLEIWRGNTHPTAAIIPKQTNGMLQPLFGIYSTKFCLEKIDRLFAQHESLSVRDFIAQIWHLEVPANKFDEANPERVFQNINTPEDFQSLSS